MTGQSPVKHPPGRRIKQWVKAILHRTPYLSRWSRQIHELGAFPAGHYYSPIPARAFVADQVNKHHIPDQIPGIELHTARQLKLVQQLAQHYRQMPFLHEAESEHQFHLNQVWFGHTDAIMLYAMICTHRFPRIIEVGSGYSTAAMLESYRSMHESDFSITCIEPYPDRLESLVDVPGCEQVTLLKKPVQACDDKLFQTLEAGDLLFIDSSHVVKYQSDLHHLLFEVLPVLKPGVMVHFHDVFYPFEYSAEWLLEGRYWNECYFLRAFLTHNSEWDIVLFNNYLNTLHGDLISELMPLCRVNQGGSLYLMKK
jgi:hypothetical protein